jgi:hypothetical protein
MDFPIAPCAACITVTFRAASSLLGRPASRRRSGRRSDADPQSGYLGNRCIGRETDSPALDVHSLDCKALASTSDSRTACSASAARRGAPTWAPYIMDPARLPPYENVLKEEAARMASGRLRCRIGWHEWTQKRSEDGQPLTLAGQTYEGCRHCDAVRERPWGGGGVAGAPGPDVGGGG